MILFSDIKQGFENSSRSLAQYIKQPLCVGDLCVGPGFVIELFVLFFLNNLILHCSR